MDVNIEYQYFTISRTGPCWESIMQTHSVGVYVPGELPSPQMDLIVLLED
jgi:type VI secretion system protein ImpJ